MDSRRFVCLVVFVGFFLCACVITYPLIFHLNDSLLCQAKDGLPSGDGGFFLWNLWWAKKALVELKTSPLYTYEMAHPIGISLVYSTSCLFYGVVSIPFQYVVSVVTIYNLIILFSLTLSGFFTYLLVRYITKSDLSGVVSGLLFSFTFYHQAHYEHLNIISTQFIPLTILFVLKAADTKKTRFAVMAAFAFLFNTFTSWYYFVFLGMFLALFLFTKMFSLRTDRMKKMDRKLFVVYVGFFVVTLVMIQAKINFRFLFFAAIGVYFLINALAIMKATRLTADLKNILVFLVVVLLALTPYMFAHLKLAQVEDIVTIPLPSKAFFSLEPLHYVVHRSPFPVDESDLYHFRTDGEFSLFFGYIPLLVLLMAILFGKKGRRWLFPAGIFFVLSLGPCLKFNGVINPDSFPFKLVILPGAMFVGLSIFDGIRVFARFGIMTLFCLSVFIGINTHDMLSRFKGRGRYVLVVLVSLFILLERSFAPGNIEEIKRPSFCKSIARDQGRYSVLDLPFLRRTMSYLYLQTLHDHPIPNYYVSRHGRTEEANYFGKTMLGKVDTLVTDEEIEKLSEDLIQLNVKYIIIHKSEYGPAQQTNLSRVLVDRLGYAVVHDENTLVVLRKDIGNETKTP